MEFSQLNHGWLPRWKCRFSLLLRNIASSELHRIPHLFGILHGARHPDDIPRRREPGRSEPGLPRPLRHRVPRPGALDDAAAAEHRAAAAAAGRDTTMRLLADRDEGPRARAATARRPLCPPWETWCHEIATFLHILA